MAQTIDMEINGKEYCSQNKRKVIYMHVDPHPHAQSLIVVIG